MARKRARSRSAGKTLPGRGETFLMPLADGRLGACRVLRVGSAEDDRFTEADNLLVGATEWMGREPPDLGEPLLRSLLILDHHRWGGQAMVNWVSGPPPATFTRLGVIEPSAAEKRLSCSAFGGWEGFPLQVLLQWRWDHDREAVLAEDEEAERQRQRAYEQAEAEKAARRAALTYEQLRKQRLFRGWEGYVDRDAIRASRKVFRDTIDALIALGPEPPEPAVLDVLRHCIERFNELDEEYRFISTIEREDIGEQFDELVQVSGVEGYEELDRWRDW